MVKFLSRPPPSEWKLLEAASCYESESRFRTWSINEINLALALATATCPGDDDAGATELLGLALPGPTARTHPRQAPVAATGTASPPLGVGSLGAGHPLGAGAAHAPTPEALSARRQHRRHYKKAPILYIAICDAW